MVVLGFFILDLSSLGSLWVFYLVPPSTSKKAALHAEGLAARDLIILYMCGSDYTE